MIYTNLFKKLFRKKEVIENDPKLDALGVAFNITPPYLACYTDYTFSVDEGSMPYSQEIILSVSYHDWCELREKSWFHELVEWAYHLDPEVNKHLLEWIDKDRDSKEK